MKSFLDFLEKASAYLEKISKPMAKRTAYFFCAAQIVVSLIAIAIAVVFFAYYFLKQTTLEVRVILVIFLLVMLFMLGSYTHMLITRDLKHIREQYSGKKEDIAKKRKIEF
jgi:membrane protein YdbS with pleckstrin-like domain